MYPAKSKFGSSLYDVIGFTFNLCVNTFVRRKNFHENLMTLYRNKKIYMSGFFDCVVSAYGVWYSELCNFNATWRHGETAVPNDTETKYTYTRTHLLYTRSSVLNLV